MPPYINLEGKIFGRLTVQKSFKIDNKVTFWLCKCICGKEKFIRSGSLIGGHTKSCVCLQKETVKKMFSVHGEAKTRFWNIWRNIKGRCQYPSHPSFKYYGGKGVTVCNRWLKYVNFKEDMWASYETHIKRYGEIETSIGRKDNNKGYSPSNCGWETREQQSRNTTKTRFLELNGVKKPLVEWSEKLGIKRATLYARLDKLNWSEEKTLTTPTKRDNKRN